MAAFPEIFAHTHAIRVEMAMHCSGPTGIDHCLVVKPGLKNAITCHVSKSPANKQLMCSGWALPSMGTHCHAAKGRLRLHIKHQAERASKQHVRKAAQRGQQGQTWQDGAAWPPGLAPSSPLCEPSGCSYNDREDGPFWTRPWCPFSLGVLLTIITLPYSGTTSLPESWH